MREGLDCVHIGCGAGFAGDRLDAALPVVRELIAGGYPAYIIFETLAERTLALAQVRRRNDRAGGYYEELEALLGPILAPCLEHGIPIIGNFGAANPQGAAERIVEIARARGCGPVRVAAVVGDDLLEIISSSELLATSFEPPARIAEAELVSANVYLGAEGISHALALGADVVVTGRVADPALAIGPLMHHFGWRPDDWDRLAVGALAGHLLECGAQVTGGYFADPGFNDVPELANIGFPIAEVSSTGEIVITKPRGTGGLVSERTVKEQVLYEIHDPSAYLTPDVVLDLSSVRITQQAPNRVLVTGARGKPRPPTLKSTVCYDGGWIGEGEISYAGPNCVARGRLAIDVLRERFVRLGLKLEQHFDLIGMASMFNDQRAAWLDRAEAQGVCEVRMRAAVSGADRQHVQRALREVEGLYTAGPAAGGGVRTAITPLMNSTSMFVDRNRVNVNIELFEG